MPFDPQIAEGELALKRIGTTDLPALAVEALEAGFDGSATRRLAALNFPTFFQVRDVLPKAMQEWGIELVSAEEGALRLARRRVLEVLATSDDPLKHLAYFA